MVSLLVGHSYFNNEQIKISDVEIMNAAFGSLGSFRSRFRSKCIGHNNYIDINIKYHSKPTPIHVPVHKSELIFLYSIRKFSWLPRAVSKGLIIFLSQNIIYASIAID